MVLAHANMLLHISGNPVNTFFENLGNTICFALFLFCFGASKFYSKENRDYKAFIKRIGLLYIAYILIALVFFIEKGYLNNFYEIFSYSIFYKLPPYSEFIIAFIIYELVFFFFRDLIKHFTKTFVSTLVVGFTFFIIGSLLSIFNIGFLNPYKALFLGYTNYFSFPIFQYFIFFITGYFYSQYRQSNIIKPKQLLLMIIITGIVYFFASLFSYLNTDLLKRWPPSFDFILNNFFIILIFIFLTNLITVFLDKPKILAVYSNISKYSIHLLYIHIFVLYLARWAGLNGFFLLTYLFTFIILSIPFIIEHHAVKTLYNGLRGKTSTS